ncbi:hypothetical protein GF386_02240 [Candidatus Pacearchaeota archaeon]|nr:hypothetical protein [Candidatus Pacearchaeota archaeon]
MKKNKESGSVVKIDSSLLEDVDKILKKEKNKFRFVNKKQFIDIAVHEFLKKMEREDES